MPFNEIPTRVRSNLNLTGSPGGVSIGLMQHTGKRRDGGADYGLTIYIGVNILQAMGLKIGDRIVAREGDGPDAGLFQIVPATPHSPNSFQLSFPGRSAEASKMGVFRIMAKNTALLKGFDFMIRTESAAWQRFGSTLTVCVPWRRAQFPANPQERT